MRIIIITFALLISALFCNAQNKKNFLDQSPSPKERAEIQTEFMKSQLNLTELQCEQVLQINITSAEYLEKIRNEENKMTKFKMFRSMIQKKNEALKKILTKQQYKKHKKTQKELKKIIKSRIKKK